MFANNSGEWSRDIYLDDSGLIHQIVGMQSWYIRGYQSMPPADKPSCTLSKTNSSSLKNGGWSTAYFRGELLVLGRYPFQGSSKYHWVFYLNWTSQLPAYWFQTFIESSLLTLEKNYKQVSKGCFHLQIDIKTCYHRNLQVCMCIPVLMLMSTWSLYVVSCEPSYVMKT